VTGSGRAAGLALAAAVALACGGVRDVAGPSTRREARLGAPFSLRAGESAALPAQDLTVGFEGVDGESRCPKDVQCVWAGDAAARIRVGRSGGSSQDLELHTNRRFATEAEAFGFVLKLVDLQPVPTSTGGVNPADYVVTLVVSQP
jgi:hypothetical protein